MMKLDKDFPDFDFRADFSDEYTGRKITGACIRAPFGSFGEKQSFGPGMFWSVSHDEKDLIFRLEGIAGKTFRIELQACRLWPAVTIFFDENGKIELDTYPLRRPAKIRLARKDRITTVCLPLKILDGFRREGFPMRINLRGNGFAWVPYRKVPDRLMLHDFDPAYAGWLLTDDGRKTRK